jgi:hypothetical protein
MTRLETIIFAIFAAVFSQVVISCTDASSGLSGSPIFKIRGGLVPQADEVGSDYYEKFELDYGSDDKSRVAGATRGFIRSGKLAGLPESDPFKKWLNQHLEKGAEPISGRVKPFYVSFMMGHFFLRLRLIDMTSRL